MTPDDFITWLDVDEIGERLAAAHHDINPLSVRFVDLKKMVAALPGFQEQAGHPVNERILEEIQRAWVEECEGRTDDED